MRTASAWAHNPSASAIDRAAGPTRANAGASARTTWMCFWKSAMRHAREARRAARRQNVIGSRHVVAEHRGRVGADEDRSRVAHERDEQVGRRAHQLEVLGGDRVRGIEGARRVVDEDHPAGRVQGRHRLVTPSCRDEQRVERELDPLGHLFVPHDQRDRAAGAVLGLRQEIHRNPGGVDGVVRDDRDLGGAREPVDPDRPEDLALGFHDVHVARADDNVDRAQRARPERHRGHGLRSTDRVHLVDAGDRGGGEDRVVQPTGRVGWRAQHHFGDARDAGGDRRHQNRRREGRAAARYVTAGAIDGHDELGHLDPETNVSRLALLLRLVPCDDLVAGELERGAQFR